MGVDGVNGSVQWGDKARVQGQRDTGTGTGTQAQAQAQRIQAQWLAVNGWVRSEF